MRWFVVILLLCLIQVLTQTTPSQSSEVSTNGEDSPLQTLPLPVSRINYASKEQGADLLESSEGSKNAHNLLTRNKDKYCIVPCNEKLSVIIQLSEQIQMQHFVLVNYELFSSTMKDFEVFGSTEYPTSSWEFLANFSGVSEEQEQVFQVRAWVRYLKFNFLSYNGVEFYCTLSQIRVHGSTAMATAQDHFSTNERTTEEAKNLILESSDDMESFYSDIEVETEILTMSEFEHVLDAERVEGSSDLGGDVGDGSTEGRPEPPSEGGGASEGGYNGDSHDGDVMESADSADIAGSSEVTAEGSSLLFQEPGDAAEANPKDSGLSSQLTTGFIDSQVSSQARGPAMGDDTSIVDGNVLIKPVELPEESEWGERKKSHSDDQGGELQDSGQRSGMPQSETNLIAGASRKGGMEKHSSGEDNAGPIDEDDATRINHAGNPLVDLVNTDTLDAPGDERSLVGESNGLESPEHSTARTNQKDDAVGNLEDDPIGSNTLRETIKEGVAFTADRRVTHGDESPDVSGEVLVESLPSTDGDEEDRCSEARTDQQSPVITVNKPQHEPSLDSIQIPFAADDQSHSLNRVDMGNPRLIDPTAVLSELVESRMDKDDGTKPLRHENDVEKVHTNVLEATLNGKEKTGTQTTDTATEVMETWQLHTQEGQRADNDESMSKDETERGVIPQPPVQRGIKV